MIKKAIGYGILFFVGFNLLVVFLPAKIGAEVNLADEENNRAKSQAYLYDFWNLKEKSVLVGTSLTGRIREEYIGPNFINLGLDAMSVHDGLAIIEKRGETPGTVFIEVNFIEKSENHHFQSSVLNPSIYYTAKFLPSSRVTNRPIEILKRIVFEGFRLIVPKGASKAEEPVYVFEEGIFPILLKNYNTKITDKEFDVAFSSLQEHINKLTAKGAKIIFYEAPVQHEFCQYVRLLQLREKVQKLYPNFHYISQPDCSEYRTYDGAHMTEASSVKYALFIKETIANFD